MDDFSSDLQQPFLSPPPSRVRLTADEESPLPSLDLSSSSPESPLLSETLDEFAASQTNDSKLGVYLLVVFLAVLWPLGGKAFEDFTLRTDSSFHPLPGSSSQQASQAFQRNYQDDWNDPMNPVLVLVLDSNVSLTEKTSPAFEAAKNFSLGLDDYLDQHCWTPHSKNDTCLENPNWIKVTSYYSLLEQKLTWMAAALATPDGLTTLVEVQYLDNTHSRERIAQLMQALDDYGLHHDEAKFHITYTGIKYFQKDLHHEMKKDLRRMDLMVLPLALLLIGVVLPQAHPGYVWILPLITMITTVSLWAIIMGQMAKTMQITQFTPSIMMSLTLGMGIDYTMFLMSRYLEDVTDKKAAIQKMHKNGGRVLLISGLTLMFSFSGLCFLPLRSLRSVGIGSSIAIACSLFVNLTLVPALLHTKLGDLVVKRENWDDSPTLTIRAQATEPSLDSSIWFRLSKHLLHPYKSIIILLLILQLMTPIARNATRVKSSIAFQSLLPANSPSLRSFNMLGEKLGWGHLTPYRILFDSHGTSITMDSVEGFDLMHRVIEELAAIHGDVDHGTTHIGTDTDEIHGLTMELMDSLGLSRHAKAVAEKEKNQAIEVAKDAREQGEEDIMCDDDKSPYTAMFPTVTYTGISVIKNIRVPHSLYHSAKICAQIKFQPYCPIEALHILDVLDNITTTEDRYATHVFATLSVDPFSQAGISWLKAARETVQRLEHGGALGGARVYIDGAAAIAYDAVDTVHSAFPFVIGATTVVVFVFMGVFFRSVFSPLRSILSIALNLTFSFGLGVLVHQNGILNWTKVRAISSFADDVCWLVPVMAFSIIVGLALDYDVLLISRILEFRLDGYEHRSSIAMALDATGGVISAAGVIMALAFGSLMFSSSPVLYQWSFLLTAAVLLDTFVIRTVWVPIITGLAGPSCWWPLKLPNPTVCFAEFNESDAIPVDRNPDTSDYETLQVTSRPS